MRIPAAATPAASELAKHGEIQQTAERMTNLRQKMGSGWYFTKDAAQITEAFLPADMGAWDEVTFDRKYRKDSFYAHKAWLSGEPFVHICGKRFVEHAEKTVHITLYSNQPLVERFAGDLSLGVQQRAGREKLLDLNKRLNRCKRYSQ